jgi:hypothetical protein
MRTQPNFAFLLGCLALLPTHTAFAAANSVNSLDYSCAFGKRA